MGHKHRTQEVGRDEEAGDNVMRRGAEPEGGGGGGGKQRRGRGGREGMLEEEEESTGCVHLALGGRER